MAEADGNKADGNDITAKIGSSNLIIPLSYLHIFTFAYWQILYHIFQSSLH
jgi:hypothetical protein